MIKPDQKGFTLFVAILTSAALLLVAMGVIAISVRQSVITSAGRESQYAFYAADSGLDCALYWDVKGDNNGSVFSTSSPRTFSCNKDTQRNPANGLPILNGIQQSNFNNQWRVNYGGTSTSSAFTITFWPDPYCAVVSIVKYDNGATKVESLGYNNCDPTASRRVQRAARANY